MDSTKKVKPFIYDMAHVHEQSKKNLFNVVSLFAGGGGSSTGYRLAGGKILAINEFVKAARDVYRANYSDTIIIPDDIRNITGQDILDKVGLKAGELDILDGSPPCASFSMAGLREKGWGREKKYSDTKQVADDLFFEYARILKDVQPKVFVAENVKGITQGGAKNLLGSEQYDLFGAHDDTIYHTLVNAGYNVRYKVLNAMHYGVPQSRERTIFIGVRNDIKKPITYPNKSNEVITLGDCLPYIKRISAKVKAFNESTERTVEKDQMIWTINADGMGATRRYYLEVDSNYKNLSDEQKRVYDIQLPGESMLACGERLNEQISGAGRIKLDINKPARTATTSAELWHPTEKRSLNIAELKTICAFPCDFYTGTTFSKQWERLGRAVPPLMMKAVAEHIYKTILS